MPPEFPQGRPGDSYVCGVCGAPAIWTLTARVAGDVTINDSDVVRAWADEAHLADVMASTAATAGCELSGVVLQGGIRPAVGSRAG